jgi:surfeit locus 1 family protein
VNPGKREFRPGLWPTLAMLLLCGVFLRLAVWQWHRAEYKSALLAAFTEQGAAPALSLNGAVHDGAFATLPRYRHVQADGAYDSGRQLLLQDMTHDDGVGYEVLTPFQLQGGGLLLVDRGWVPALESGKPPLVAVADAPRHIRGMLGALPVPGLRLGEGAAPAAGWPKILFYPRRQDLAPIYGDGLLAPVLLLDGAEPDGYVRDFSPDVGFPPARHLAYAFQWVALAAAVFIVWLVVNLRRRPPA